MKRSEILETYREKIVAWLVDLYGVVVGCDGRIQYAAYIWEDGELECLEQVQGDHSWLKANDNEPRSLFYITTVGGQRIDPWDYADDPRPDDEEEAEKMRREIVAWLVDGYADAADELLDSIIEEAQQEEDWEEETFSDG